MIEGKQLGHGLGALNRFILAMELGEIKKSVLIC